MCRGVEGRNWNFDAYPWHLSSNLEDFCVCDEYNKKKWKRKGRALETREDPIQQVFILKEMFFLGVGEANQKSSYTRSLRRPLVKLSGVIHGPSEPALLKLSTYLSNPT